MGIDKWKRAESMTSKHILIFTLQKKWKKTNGVGASG